MAGLARVRTSKGLFLILSLLCLVHVATSLLENFFHKMIEEQFQEAREDLKKMKADHEKEMADASKQLNEGKKQLVALEEIMKESSGEFPPLLELPNVFKRFIENMEAYMDRANQDFAKDLSNRVIRLELLRKELKEGIQEQHQVEL